MSLSKWLNKEKELLSSKELGPLVFETLKLQVRKDFNLEQDLSDTLEYADLERLIVNELSPLWTGQDESLKHLLYRIDLSEQKVRDKLQQKSIAEQIEALASLIAERELKKVITRLYFSGKLS